MAIPKTWSYHSRFNRWIYFAILLLANLGISILKLPPLLLAVVVILGLALPLYIAWRTSTLQAPGQPPSYSVELFESFPTALILAGFALCVFLRFYKLEGLFAWPNGDEGWIGMNAMELARHWNWKFFYTTGEVPPLSVWAVAAMFKTGLSPFLCLWFLPAAASSLTVAAGYYAARQLFSRSFSLLAGALLAFSYWPLFIGRTCNHGVWMAFWVCGCFFFLGRFLKNDTGSQKGGEAAVLGFVSGLGSLIFTPWPVVTLAIAVFVYQRTMAGERKNRKNFFIFTAFLLLSLLPYLAAVLSARPGQHASAVAAWSGWFPWNHQIPVVLHYFTCLFWKDFDDTAAYTPTWWGFLNPVLSSFFFLGVMEILPYRRIPRAKWFFPLFLFFMLPGLLTMNLEAFRIIQVMPLLTAVSALGLFSFLTPLPPAGRIPALAVILLVSGSMDFFQLTAPFRDIAAHPGLFGRNGRSFQRYKAYQELLQESRQKGPGLIFTDFDPDSPNDTTLSLMTHPFNAALNPALDSSQAQWAALFVNVNYKPYLEARFPNGRWDWMAQGLSIDNGGYMLGVINLTPETRPVIAQWLQVHGLFHENNLLWYSQSRLMWDEVFQSLQKAEPLVQQDPFLFTVYWEKTAAYYYKKVDFPDCIKAYLKAINQGYPTAGLCYDLGDLMLALKYPKDAIPALRLAVKAPLDMTSARSVLLPMGGYK